MQHIITLYGTPLPLQHETDYYMIHVGDKYNQSKNAGCKLINWEKVITELIEPYKHYSNKDLKQHLKSLFEDISTLKHMYIEETEKTSKSNNLIHDLRIKISVLNLESQIATDAYALNNGVPMNDVLLITIPFVGDSAFISLMIQYLSSTNQITFDNPEYQSGLIWHTQQLLSSVNYIAPKVDNFIINSFFEMINNRKLPNYARCGSLSSLDQEKIQLSSDCIYLPKKDHKIKYAERLNGNDAEIFDISLKIEKLVRECDNKSYIPTIILTACCCEYFDCKEAKDKLYKNEEAYKLVSKQQFDKEFMCSSDKESFRTANDFFNKYKKTCSLYNYPNLSKEEYAQKILSLMDEFDKYQYKDYLSYCFKELTGLCLKA